MVHVGLASTVSLSRAPLRPRSRQSIVPSAWCLCVPIAISHAAPSDCGCLNWKSTYKQGLRCGAGAEFFGFVDRTNLTKLELLFASKNKIPGVVTQKVWPYGFGMYEEVCGDSFLRLNTNSCVNIQYGAPHRQYPEYDGVTWCYVPKTCDILHGGGPVKTKGLLWGEDWTVNWKVCGETDTHLHDLPPKELFTLGKAWGQSAFVDDKKRSPPGNAWGINIAFLARQAYPTLSPQRWNDIEPAYSMGKFHLLPEMLQNAMIDKRAMVVNAEETGQHTLMVIFGWQLWRLEPSAECTYGLYCQYCMRNCAAPSDDPSSELATLFPPSANEFKDLQCKNKAQHNC